MLKVSKLLNFIVLVLLKSVRVALGTPQATSINYRVSGESGGSKKSPRFISVLLYFFLRALFHYLS